MPARWRLALLAALVGSSQAQLVQNGSFICNWAELRGTPDIWDIWGIIQTGANVFAANILRDTVYMDGGELTRQR